MTGRHTRPRPRTGRRILQFVSGLSLTLAILCAFHVGWVWWGDAFDGIHTQQTLAVRHGVKDVDAGDATRIAEPRGGDPPAETEPGHGAVIGWMWIPRFGHDWKRAIQEGTGTDVLANQGIGHYGHTPMPGGKGNSAYAGHRTPGDLGAADTLEPGDPIVIQTARHWYVYKVQSSWMTTPDDVAVVADQPGQGDTRSITLTTCKWSLDEADSLSARLIIRGRLESWSDVGDGIPAELADGTSRPAVRARMAASRVIRRISVRMPVSRILAAAAGGAWLLLAGLAWLIWHGGQAPERTHMEPADPRLAHPDGTRPIADHPLHPVLDHDPVRRMGVAQPLARRDDPPVLHRPVHDGRIGGAHGRRDDNHAARADERRHATTTAHAARRPGHARPETMQDPHARDHAHVVDHVGRVPRVRDHARDHAGRDRAHRPDGGPARPRPHHPIHAGNGKEARTAGVEGMEPDMKGTYRIIDRRRRHGLIRLYLAERPDPGYTGDDWDETAHTSATRVPYARISWTRRPPWPSHGAWRRA